MTFKLWLRFSLKKKSFSSCPSTYNYFIRQDFLLLFLIHSDSLFYIYIYTHTYPSLVYFIKTEILVVTQLISQVLMNFSFWLAKHCFRGNLGRANKYLPPEFLEAGWEAYDSNWLIRATPFILPLKTKYVYIPSRMAEIWNTDNTRCWQV